MFAFFLLSVLLLCFFVSIDFCIVFCLDFTFNCLLVFLEVVRSRRRNCRSRRPRFFLHEAHVFQV